MEWVQLKDMIFKEKIKHFFNEYNKCKYGCDYEIVINNKRFLFEYENSSRGCSSNFLRVMRLFKNDEDICLVFIRTKHHQKVHTRDWINVKNIWEKIDEKYKNKMELICLNDNEFSQFLQKIKSP